MLLVESRSPDFQISLGFARLFYEHSWLSLLMFLVIQIPFSCTKNLPLWIEYSHVQICIAAGDGLENSNTNACCMFLFNCDRAYSNTLNAFSHPMKGISISVKIKTSNMKKKILTFLKTYCHNEKKFERGFAYISACEMISMFLNTLYMSQNAFIRANI